MPATLSDDLKTALKTALKNRDRVAVTALRSALSAIDNAGAVPVEERSGPVAAGEHVAGAVAGLGAAEAERRVLTDGDVRSIVEGEVRERTAAAAEYEGLGRGEAAERLRAEAEVLSRYLEPTA